MSTTATTTTTAPALFRPITLGRYKLQHRIAMAPLTRARSVARNEANDLIATYYAQRATPGGLLISEASPISEEGRPSHLIPSIYNEGQIAAWKRVTDAVHAKGGIIFIQLWHVGRASHSYFNPNGLPPASSSAKNLGGTVNTPDGPMERETPREVTVKEIHSIVEDYAQASRNAIEAGFDGVEIHGANGYLIDQFLNSNINDTRTDEYGGSPVENRIRFALDVVRACCAAIGPDRVGIRLSPYGKFQGTADANPIETWTALLSALNEFDIAFVHLVEPRIKGGWEDPETVPETCTLAPFREAYKGTVIVAGAYTAETATHAVESGRADLVAFGRYFISNPDLPERIRYGYPLTPYDRPTFYTPGEKGFTDYLTYEEQQAKTLVEP